MNQEPILNLGLRLEEMRQRVLEAARSTEKDLAGTLSDDLEGKGSELPRDLLTVLAALTGALAGATFALAARAAALCATRGAGRSRTLGQLSQQLRELTLLALLCLTGSTESANLTNRSDRHLQSHTPH